MVTNEIEAISGATVTLKYRLDYPNIGNTIGTMKLGNVTWGKTSTAVSAYPDGSSLYAYAPKNVTISDMKLSNAKGAGFGWQGDNALNLNMFNVEIEGRSVAYGNGLSHCLFRNIKARYNDFFCDMKAGYYKTRFENIEADYVPRTFGDTPDQIVSCGVSIRKVDFTNVKFRGAHPGRYIVAADDVTFDSCVLETASIDSAIAFNNTPSGLQNENFLMKNCVIIAPGTSQFIYSAPPVGGENSHRRARFSKNVFKGIPTTGRAMYLNAGTEFFFDENDFENGGYIVANVVTGFARGNRFASGVAKSNSAGSTFKFYGARSSLPQGHHHSLANTSSTTAENVVLTVPLPAGVLEIGDSIRVSAFGRFTGANGVKNVRLTAGGVTGDGSATYAAAAGETSWRLEFELFCRTTTTNQRISGWGGGKLATVNPSTGTVTADISTTTVNIELRAWVANATDAIIFDGVVVEPRPTIARL